MDNTVNHVPSAKVSTSTNQDSHTGELENKLTQKFLRGEISFADYSSQWYRGKEEEDGQIEISLDDEFHNITEGKRKGFSGERRKCARLSPALLGLMGEANLRFVRGDKEVAEKMCYEIIRQVPTAPEPYQTLAQIHENDMEKSLQFSLLAAHLSPSDANEWLRLASISKTKKDPKQEMLCYTQAIKAEPHNLQLHLHRIDLLTELEAINYPTSVLKINKVKCYHKIVTSMPAEQGETIMKFMKLAAKIYHNNNEVERALEIMAAAYKKCSELFTLEESNLFLELLIGQKQYETCIEVFVANVGVEIEAEIQTISQGDKLEEKTNYLNCVLPDDLPVDLTSKLIVCFIHLEAINLAIRLLEDFLKNDVEKAGDLYMDIEEALSAVGLHELALTLLDPLIKNKNFDLGAVWLKHAECLSHLGREDEAIESYYKVLHHAPQHFDARNKLFRMLEKRNRIDEALAVLQQDYKLAVSAALLKTQCDVLKKYNKTLEFLEAGEVLLQKTIMRFRHRDELRLARHTKVTSDVVYNFRTARGENPYNDDDIHFDEDETFKLSPDEEIQLFKELFQIAMDYKKYWVMQRLAYGAYFSKNISSDKLGLELHCLQASLLNQDYASAFPIAKDLAFKHKNVWTYNILGFVAKLTDDNNFHKTLIRKLRKGSGTDVRMFIGNDLLSSGRFYSAIRFFLDYHGEFRDPLSALLIAVTLLNLGTMRVLKNQECMLLQGFAYLQKYETLRQCSQEVYYNMGRAYQMLSMNNLAVEYYERALASPPAGSCERHGTLDLTMYIAHNLVILYKEHAPHMAQSIMQKYLVF